jgi:ferric-dicitrate binding protein FerR (iron transport regulator)
MTSKDDHLHEQGPGAGTDADLAALLRAVGPREQPSAEMTAEVRAALAAEWRTAVAARQAASQPATPSVVQRRPVQPWLAVAASVTAVAIAIGIALPRLNGSADPLATVARVDGRAEIRHEGGASWQPMTVGASVAEADVIRTLDDGRVAVRRADGLEVRLDAATQLAFNSDERATLMDGRVYVDAGRPGNGMGPFVLRTPQGEVRHLGTQYSARLQGGALQVAVREGSVAIDRGPSPVVARAGEALLVANDGLVQRSSVTAYGDSWRWAEAVAPKFAIEGRSLDEFLAWAARETGRDVIYASADAAHEAEATRLKGSVAGLSPEAAVTAVLAAEPGLRHEIAGGQIRIERASR